MSYIGNYLTVKLAKSIIDNHPCEEEIIFYTPRINIVSVHKNAGWGIKRQDILFKYNFNSFKKFKYFNNFFNEITNYLIDKGLFLLHILSIIIEKKVKLKPFLIYISRRFYDYFYYISKYYTIIILSYKTFMNSFCKLTRQLNILDSSFTFLKEELLLLLNLHTYSKKLYSYIINFQYNLN